MLMAARISDESVCDGVEGGVRGDWSGGEQEQKGQEHGVRGEKGEVGTLREKGGLKIMKGRRERMKKAEFRGVVCLSSKR